MAIKIQNLSKKNKKNKYRDYTSAYQTDPYVYITYSLCLSDTKRL